MKFFFNSAETNKAISAKDKFVKLYGQNKVDFRTKQPKGS